MAVDGHASESGAAYAGMNADCNACDPRIAWVPGAEHPEGSKRPIYIFAGTAPRFIGYGRGKFYEPKAGENLTESMGHIPQVRRTYGYWEGALPMMNEKGLTMGESSCASRLLNYPIGRAPEDGDPRFHRPAVEALLDLSNIMQIAMERCETARCAVETMGAMSDEYGFCPMIGEWSLGVEADGKVAFDDGGEGLTVADRHGEAWIFHVVGGVPGVSKSVWAAMRLPKGHAAFIANNFILRHVPEAPTDEWLFSPKLRSTARAAGIWDGKEPLDFARIFAPDAVTFQSPAGSAPIPLYASLRQWRLAKLAAPKAIGDVLPIDPLDLPSTIKVESSLGRQDVFAWLSDIYEGSEFDLTQGVLAGPFGNPFRLEGGNATGALGQIPRGIAIARTSYSVIGESRPAHVAEPVLWFAPDTPVTSVYLPFYPSAGGAHAPELARGTLHRFSRDSAFWAFDFVSNWASLVNWRHASENFVLPLRAEWHKKIADEMPVVEARARREGAKALAEWQVRTQRQVVERWWQLADDLIATYNDGFLNQGENLGANLGYPEWWAREIGFNQDVHPIFIKRDGLAQERYEEKPGMCPPGWRPWRSTLPAGYNFAGAHWLYETDRHGDVRGSRLDTERPIVGFGFHQVAVGAIACIAGAVLLGCAFIGGAVWERRRAASAFGAGGGILLQADVDYMRLT